MVTIERGFAKARQIFKEQGGSRAIQLGIHPRTLYALRDAGEIEQFAANVCVLLWCSAGRVRPTSQISNKPLPIAMATACVLSLARSLLIKFLIWKLTVVSAMESR